jgi:hypothetical protein
VAVAGHGGEVAVAEGLVALGPALALGGVRGLDALQRRLEHDHAGLAIHDDRPVRGRVEELGAEPDRHRQPEPARDHRGVGGRPARGERDRHDLGAQLGNVGRTELVGDEHGVAGARVLRLLRLRQPDRATPERADVIGARGEHGVTDRRDRFGVAGGGGLERGRGGEPVEHHSLDIRDQARVLGHQHPGADDLGLVGATVVVEPEGERLQLVPGRGERRARSLQLQRAPRLRDPLARLDARMGEAGATDRQPRRCREPFQDVLGHQPGATNAVSSARTIRAVDVAPGSWCPTERSPR